MHIKKISFPTFEKFTIWKKELEKASKAKLINRMGTRLNLNKTKRFNFFVTDLVYIDQGEKGYDI